MLLKGVLTMVAMDGLHGLWKELLQLAMKKPNKWQKNKGKDILWREKHVYFVKQF